MQLSDSDYYTLDHFILAVLTRVRDGHCSAGEGRSSIMHALSAWDQGNAQEFAPWMELQMEEWGRDGGYFCMTRTMREPAFGEVAVTKRCPSE
ncbi:MAG: hypothetical protein DI565_15980 [Ancylobacter novellus]|uniref:Uncharacterized protein n=1 Tax=Ancylobacter novellus TaxID=921 RepID=A0A2W5MG06_ANCNO|nr:MAG: hypothetical protein DI565_15980 [Ancylobacter novellus]